MNKVHQTTDVTATGATPAASNLAGTLLRVAWLSILLGFAMEALLLLLVMGFGKLPGLRAIIADLVQKVSWSVFVCVGVAVGTAVSKAREAMMGLCGFLAAPLAFNIARFLHKSAAHALAVVGPAAGGPSPVLLGLLKGIEYASLGAAVGWVGRRPWGGAAAHVAVGLAAGVIFGGTILALMVWAAPEPLPPVGLLARGVNEVLFPIGCSIVLFAADVLGKRSGR